MIKPNFVDFFVDFFVTTAAFQYILWLSAWFVCIASANTSGR